MTRLRQPAFANQLREKRQAGERVGLCVIAVHHWNCGEHFADRDGVFRIVIPPDLHPAGADYSALVGLDVLVCGAEWPAMYMAARGALAGPAASVWVEVAAGIQEVEHHWWCKPEELMAASSLIPPSAFARHLHNLRQTRLLAGDGIYGTAPFRDVRERAWRDMFGVDLEMQTS